MTASAGTTQPDLAWDGPRWVRILDRIEHRQPHIGLRFWGPPLWLEVLMTGPDSGSWPAVAGRDTSWDWQSSHPCAAVAEMVEDGADDDRLLAVVGRYTIENLILNAVHEIGEWLRFDGRRVFPAHLERRAPLGDGDQGNGDVVVDVAFGPPHGNGCGDPIDGAAATAGEPDLDRIAAVAPAARFTYLPGTTIAVGATGPVISSGSTRAEGVSWQSSSADAGAAEDDDEVFARVARDVHAALVRHETERICEAFHIDGRRPWHQVAPGPTAGRDVADGSAGLAVSIHQGAPASLAPV
jgi:hypothetical protein